VANSLSAAYYTHQTPTPVPSTEGTGVGYMQTRMYKECMLLLICLSGSICNRSSAVRMHTTKA